MVSAGSTGCGLPGWEGRPLQEGGLGAPISLPRLIGAQGRPHRAREADRGTRPATLGKGRGWPVGGAAGLISRVSP